MSAPYVILEHRDTPSAQSRRIADELLRRGELVEMVCARELSLSVSATDVSVWRLDQRLSPRAVITQGLNRSWSAMLPMLRCLEEQGVVVCNPTAGSTIALDKADTARALIRAGLPTLPLRMYPWGARLGVTPPFTGPFVTKPVRGSSGRDVERHDGFDTAARTLSTNQQLGADGVVGTNLLQPLASTAGTDLRILVMHDQVVSSVERRAISGFVANWPNAASRQRSDDTANALAVAAVQVLGLSYGGVDLVFHDGAWQVLEVNCWPQDLDVMGRFAGRDLFTTLCDVVQDWAN